MDEYTNPHEFNFKVPPSGRALRVLWALWYAADEPSVSAVSRALGCDRATARKGLEELRARGLVDQHDAPRLAPPGEKITTHEAGVVVKKSSPPGEKITTRTGQPTAHTARARSRAELELLPEVEGSVVRSSVKGIKTEKDDRPTLPGGAPAWSPQDVDRVQAEMAAITGACDRAFARETLRMATRPGLTIEWLCATLRNKAAGRSIRSNAYLRAIVAEHCGPPEFQRPRSAPVTFAEIERVADLKSLTRATTRRTKP